MNSVGAYFRASVRRELALPPVWIGRARRGVTETVTLEHAGALLVVPDPVPVEFEAIETGGCAPPVLVPKSRAKAGVDAEARVRDVPSVEPVSRAAAGRSAAATSERMDVTAGETATAKIARDMGLLKAAPKANYLRFVEAAKAKAAARPPEKPAPTRVAMSPEECKRCGIPGWKGCEHQLPYEEWKPVEQRADPEKYAGHHKGKHRRGGRQAVRI